MHLYLQMSSFAFRGAPF